MSILSEAGFWTSILLLFLATPTITSSSTTTTTNQPKSVKILLQSKWSQTPLYLEVAEFLSEENQDFYWQFLEDLQPNLLESNGNLSQHDQYELSLRLAAKLLRSEEKLSILKFSLSLRSYSPKVITFKNIIDDIIDNHLKDCDGAFLEASVPAAESGQQWSRYFCGDHLESIEKWLDQQMNYMKTKSANNDLDHPMVYSVDHIYPGKYSSLEASSTMLTVILYANIGSAQFFRLHDFLKQQIAMNKPIRYLIRHYPLVNVNANKVALSGYGVELAIKSTEYKAQDDSRVRGEVVNSNLLVESEQTGPDEVAGFVFSRLKSNNVLLSEKLNDFRSYLIDQEKEIATLKVWELQEISLQAVTKVLSVQKEKALSVLKEISQNFPSVARSLVKIHVEPELKREIIKNQNLFYQNLNLATSDTALFVNGLYHDVDALDVFTLLDTVRQEFSTVSKLHSLLNGDHERIRKLDSSWDRQQNFDFQLDIRDAAVQYMNDIENDRMYRGWPSSLNELLRPTYPGMLRNIRRNMYHLVLVVNPAKKECFDMLRMAESFYIHKAPVRIGLVFDVSDNLTLTGYQDAGVAALQAYNYIAQEKTPYEALSFLTDVIAYLTSQNAGDGRDLQPDDIISHFKSKIKPQQDLEDVFGDESSYDTGRKLARDFLSRTGLQNGPKALLNGVLLKESHLNADYFEDAVLSEIMKQSGQLQKAIYKNELTDQHDILDWLMSKKSVMSRLNKIILGLDQPKNQPKLHSSVRVLDLTSGQLLKGISNDDDYYRANINDLQLTLASTVRYINSKKDCNPVTVWLASDFQSPESRRVFLAALNHLKENSRSMRLALIYADHNPMTVILDTALNTITSSSQLLNFFIQLVESIDSTNVDRSKGLDVDGKDLDMDHVIGRLVPEEYRQAFLERQGRTDSSFGLHQAVSSRLFNLLPNITGSYDHLALVLNGKIFKMAVRHTAAAEQANIAFNEDDFALMERFVQNFWSDRILAVLNDAERSSGTRKCSDLVLRICSVLLAKQATAKQRYDISNVNEDHSVLTLEPPLVDQPFIELNVILDPLSRGAQKISPILETFYKVFNTKIRIYFNAVDKHSDMPLKLFYRFVLDHQPRFDQTTGRLMAPFALFQAMPTTPLFTLGMSVPENWMVEAVEAVYDLDNIHLAQVSGNVVGALFELEHLLVEGHCFEQSSGSPPRGLQITLGTESTPTMYDTIVMANLGYFQLKAAPGVWLLRLRQGRSSDIYSIVSQEGSDQVIGNHNGDVITLVNSFRSLVIKLRVGKKPGKQHEELLYDSDESTIRQESGGWFSSWNSGQSEGREKGVPDGSLRANDEDEDSKRINIFSVASGHLYERLLRIMMLSVLKHTQTPVKFWFLKNYLSPHFKKVLPFMAQKYNFQYELVQYKWPRWLHQQTEKQRIIWGYKILFLDVLFPLDVKKIIFVDADQVVRADLKELRDFDLEGAPYGYTPFCDSRKDMDGFRFWKSGYWATHLHGRKYHISALYVVDLQKFRRIAAGDRLRGQYQGLSQDPNSLSNLDQDLPNNMIHQVAIKSLPQEWLWCETWCDDQSKSRAKTIDLCNNPKTKEPKLTAARRIVAEWEDYDRELREFLEELQQQMHLNQTKTDHQTAPIIEEIHYQAPLTAKQEAGDSHSHQEL